MDFSSLSTNLSLTAPQLTDTSSAPDPGSDFSQFTSLIGQTCTLPADGDELEPLQGYADQNPYFWYQDNSEKLDLDLDTEWLQENYYNSLSPPRPSDLDFSECIDSSTFRAETASITQSFAESTAAAYIAPSQQSFETSVHQITPSSPVAIVNHATLQVTPDSSPDIPLRELLKRSYEDNDELQEAQRDEPARKKRRRYRYDAFDPEPGSPAPAQLSIGRSSVVYTSVPDNRPAIPPMSSLQGRLTGRLNHNGSMNRSIAIPPQMDAGRPSHTSGKVPPTKKRRKNKPSGSSDKENKYPEPEYGYGRSRPSATRGRTKRATTNPRSSHAYAPPKDSPDSTEDRPIPTLFEDETGSRIACPIGKIYPGTCACSVAGNRPADMDRHIIFCHLGIIVRCLHCSPESIRANRDVFRRPDSVRRHLGLLLSRDGEGETTKKDKQTKHDAKHHCVGDDPETLRSALRKFCEKRGLRCAPESEECKRAYVRAHTSILMPCLCTPELQTALDCLRDRARVRLRQSLSKDGEVDHCPCRVCLEVLYPDWHPATRRAKMRSDVMYARRRRWTSTMEVAEDRLSPESEDGVEKESDVSLWGPEDSTSSSLDVTRHAPSQLSLPYHNASVHRSGQSSSQPAIASTSNATRHTHSPGYLRPFMPA